MFAFTSMGGRVDKTINQSKGPYIFKMSGQNYHHIGSLLPEIGKKPKFAQLYIYDTENEMDNGINNLQKKIEHKTRLTLILFEVCLKCWMNIIIW